ncbi:sigma-70 family RNA polymerase sigma factor [Streptomyces phaeolivaceus]|uniref:Sigma-70 family RNA polymerase sigma factor n=1 Tax=Streptomyces phaeolivaceus TaxID=2653200 RepID=A0A5P8KFL6_9ACTN|nr:sigma-70 family RNA polymerase sigma factor [Streptomyces phaeolivaceus]QFR02134.1 sigma-70 family RNA polymerase sigma factor [Streptomyces phaeolivaceus]
MTGTAHEAHEAHEEEPDPPAAQDSTSVETSLARGADGDKNAFTGVYEALARPVMGLACRILHDPAQAEEVTQDVMVEVRRTADRYRPGRGSAKGWVLTLAHRRAVDRVRHAQAATQRELRAGAVIAGREHDEVAETVEDDDERRRAQECLDQLARLYRIPLTLAYYRGQTYVEVAATLSAPAGTVKSRMRTGPRLLRDCLGARS